LEEVEIPALKPGHVLVKILASALCHSQLNEIRGWKGAEYIPHLMGHEAAGVVVELGEGVNKVKQDDYVVLTWIKGNGQDVPEAKYQSAVGLVSAGAVATFTEYAVVSENRVVPIPPNINPRIASLFGCAVLTGGGMAKNLKLAKGDTLAVFGVGGIGSSAVLKAKSDGATVTVIDIVDWKLQWAKETLGTEAIHPAHIGPKKFDFVIECSGTKEAMEMAFVAANNEGTVVLAGNLSPGARISLDPFELIKGKKLSGSWGGGSFPDKDIPAFAAEYLNGRLPLEKLISKTYSFEQINEGLKDLETGKLIKGVIIMHRQPSATPPY